MAISFSSHDVIDIDKLSASTIEKLEKLRPLSSECCIYKVPDGSRRLNEHVYTPRVVSIGPIHYGKEKLQAMEEHKQRYLKDFLQLSEVILKECFQLIEDNEQRLRNCYADIIDLKSEDFLKMVLVDATFLIMVFLRSSFDFSTLSCSIERMFEKPRMMYDIRYDIVLLENQVPFFILEELFKLSKLQNILERDFDLSSLSSDFNEETAMIILAYRFLKDWNMTKIPKRIPPSKAEHILDLLRSCLIPANWDSERKATKTTNIPSMKELCQAGVRIQVGSEENMFDLKFANGILEIPPLKVNEDTEVVLRNLQAFELCHRIDKVFCDYFAMMRRFTISSADVELLIHKEVIKSELFNAESVSTLFQHIDSSNIISASRFSYSDVITGLNEYYGVTWNRWKASWKEKYFKAPWAIFSVVAAVILLVLAIVQTVCSILKVT